MAETTVEHEPWKQFGIELTPEEIQWLQDHRSVKFGFDPQWPPFSFYPPESEAEGIDIDFVKLVGERLGISFEMVRSETWSDVDAQLQRGEFAIVSGIYPTEHRAKKLLFTESYVNFPVAIITRVDGPFLTDIHHVQNLRMVNPRGYVTTNRLKQDFPDLLLTETDTLLSALRYVSEGKADFTFENLASISYLIREHGLTNLKIAGLDQSTFALHFGIHRDLPLLHTSFEKALASISSQERATILSNWIFIEQESPNALLRYLHWIIAGVVLALFVMGLMSFQNRKLRKELVQRGKIESELRRLNEEKSQFLSTVAHDVSNPLAAIKFDCQAAIEREENFSSHETSAYTNIYKHALRISHLISGLLDRELEMEGKKRIQARSVNLNEVIGKVISGYSIIAQRKNISIKYLPDHHSDLVICADPQAVMQVLENLISNAVKFSPHSSTVTISSRSHQGQARVEVRDMGPGISEEDRPKLFGRFQRLSARPTSEESSHGLGLSIVKELMDEMGGTVWVESAQGQGAKFVVEFPSSPAQ